MMDDEPVLATQDAESGASPSAEFVTITRAELEILRQLAAGATAAPSAGGPSPERPAEAGARGLESQLAKELAARDRKISELEEAYRGSVRDRELAAALAGRALVAGAAAQLIKLWRDEFDAYEEGGRYKVASRDGRSVAQAVKGWLDSPEFAHFCLPTSRGGTAVRDANRAAGPLPATAPLNLGEAAVQRWREQAAAQPANLLKPIGLKRGR
jgi:hypothetical protein